MNAEGYAYHVRRDGWRLVFSPERAQARLQPPAPPKRQNGATLAGPGSASVVQSMAI